MKDSSPAYQRFLAELKRRKVFRVMAVYGIVGFIVLQVVDLAVPALLLPDWTYRFVALLLLVGLPVAVVLAWAFEQTPQGLKRTERAAPTEIEAIVAAPVHQRWPAGLLALLGVTLLVGGWWLGQRGTAEAGTANPDDAPAELRLALADERRDSLPSLAVLPFVDMSPDRDQEYFSDGITEETLNVLAKLPELRVAARTSAFAFKDRQMDMRAVGDSLGVAYLIEGSVRKSGDQLRITAQLIDSRTGSHVWSDTYDRTLDNVFQIQTEIAEAIANQLRVPLGIDEPSDLVTPTSDVEAYDLYLAGRARMRERGDSLDEAIRLFEAAIARDSGWAPPWASLAEATELRLWYVNGTDGPDLGTMTAALDRAERAARQALALDPRSASAHVALGNVLRDRFEWREAGAAYRAALAIDPDYSEAHQGYSELLVATGRAAEAVQSAARAAALDPAPIRMNMLGWNLATDGRESEAIQAFEKGISLDPDGKLGSLRSNLGLLHYDAERYDEAYDAWASIPGARQELDQNWSGWIAALRTGRLSAVPDSVRQYLKPEDLIHLGEPEMAANALANPPHPDWIGFMYRVWSPFFDSIRGHPAVQGYLRDRGLEGVTVQRTPPAERKLPAVLRDLHGGDGS
ncbi:MAG TPA: tetratricopeptide repeat protein [Gemmatimonadota bacterium]|nr:tetratricopeptide repeat protein [Gemmatimonadota bacterium]